MMSSKKSQQTFYVPPPLRGRRSPHEPSMVNISNAKDTKSKIPRTKSREVDALQSLLKDLSVSNSSSQVGDSPSAALISDSVNERTHLESVLDCSKFAHVIELFSPNTELRADDLQAELSGFEDSGFFLKWIDDSHCLAVFSSVTEANRAMSQISGLTFEARRVQNASPASKLKLSKSIGDWAMPYKQRPPTTSSVAKRLITGHLGLKPSNPKSPQEIEQEKRDRQALAEARAEYERRKQAQKAMWDGD